MLDALPRALYENLSDRSLRFSSQGIDTVESTAFLSDHKTGLGGLLGISFRSAQPDRVVAQMAIGPEHADSAGRVCVFIPFTADVSADSGGVL